ncbi:hypothetical protein SCHPADRAFT_945741 [Schizopora paradoxa]|uniref:Uncharacterized protein n=1 Tax=Schizopora paradoxa TaxID=27342 RepID=A0A0H2RPW1_9AGAM|nr:hypothetical protein SCHPADRAFT_945741 [Schizopora paradoxa]
MPRISKSMGASASKKSNTKVTVFGITQVMKTARTEFLSLCVIIEDVKLLPDQLQRECLDIFHYHLRKPIEDHLCESDHPYGWIMQALWGIKNLGPAYFKRSAFHNQQFVDCWPDIFKWLRVMQKNDAHLEFDNGSTFWSVAGEMFDLCLALNYAALHDDDVNEFAVLAWMGYRDENNIDRFGGQPLLACLKVQLPDEGRPRTEPKAAGLRIERALEACHYDIYDLVGVIHLRLKHTIDRNISVKARPEEGILGHSALMSILLQLRWPPFTKAIALPNIGRCFVYVIQSILMDGLNYSVHRMYTLNSLLTVVYVTLLSRNIDYAVVIVQHGILGLLLRVAKLESMQPIPETSSTSRDTLFAMLPYLIYKDMIITCRNALEDIQHDEEYEDLKEEAHQKFQLTWEAFENVLFEHFVLLRLCKAGFAPETGVCANDFVPTFRNAQGALPFFIEIKDTSLDTLRYKRIRFPRRIASFYIQRHLRQLLPPSFFEKGKSKNAIPAAVAIYIDYMRYPFQFRVYRREAFEKTETRENAELLTLVAHEVHRQPEEQSHGLMVILGAPMWKEVPFVIHFDDPWMKDVKLSNASDDYEGIPFDGKNNCLLPCRKLDALRACIVLAKRYADEKGDSVWLSDAVDKAVGDVMKEFDEELGIFKQSSDFVAKSD